jgi:hypothetical protein
MTAIRLPNRKEYDRERERERQTEREEDILISDYRDWT